MSETLGTVTLELTTEDTKLRKGLRNAKRDAQKLGRSMGRVGKKLTAAITLPVLGLGVAILKVAANFETSMNQVQALTNATGEDFAKLEDQAKELGATTQFSASQAADAMGFMAQAGLDVDQIYSSLPATLDLAAASQQDLATTADQMTNIMAGFGIAATESARVADTLTAAFIGSNTNLTDLAQAMSFAAPVAAGFGLTLAETAAVVGFMGNVGIKASRAGTALSGALVRLSDPASNVRKLMESLGIEVLDSEGKMKSMVGILQELEKSGAGTTEIMKIFGLRAGPATAALVRQGSEGLQRFTDEINKAGGAAARVGAVQMKGLTGALNALKSAMEAVAIAIGKSGLLEWVTDVAKATADWFRELSKTNPVVLKWGVILAGLAVTLGPLLIAVGLIATAISLISAPVLIVIAAIAAAGGLIATFWLMRDEIAEAVESTFNAVKQWLQDAMAGVFDWITGAIEGLLDLINSVTGAINSATISGSGGGGGASGDPFFDDPFDDPFFDDPLPPPSNFSNFGTRPRQQNNLTIAIHGNDASVFTADQIRDLVEAINEEMADDSTNLRVQTI